MRVNKKVKKNWSKEDVVILVWLLDNCGKDPNEFVNGCLIQDDDDWKAVAEFIPGKEQEQSRFKWMALRRQVDSAKNIPWSSEEDMFLKGFIRSLQKISWFEVARQLYYNVGKDRKVYRSPKYCRERWCCYLNPNLKKGLWSCSDDKALITEVLRVGKKWAKLSKTIALDGRTENSIKNRFDIIMKKRMADQRRTKQVISEKDYLVKALGELEIKIMIEPRPFHPSAEEEEVAQIKPNEPLPQLAAQKGQHGSITLKTEEPRTPSAAERSQRFGTLEIKKTASTDWESLNSPLSLTLETTFSYQIPAPPRPIRF